VAPDFTIAAARPVSTPSFLAIEMLDVRAPDGEALERVVVRHPGAVVVVPVLDDGVSVLVLRQYRSALDADLLEVPAGKRDVEGEPPELTAARELEEETGHRAGRIEKLAEFYNSPGFTDEHSHLYLARDLEAVTTPEATSAEERYMTVETIRLDELDGLIARGELVDAKSIIGLLLARDHLRTE
jgi:ADP-ribose pyrophosphatase